MELKQFDGGLNTYVDAQGNPLTEDEIRELSYNSNDDTIAATVFLASLVFNGGISVDEWESEFEETIKKEYIRQYTLGAGGEDQLSKEDMAIILGILLVSLGFLRFFSQRIRNGEYSEAQIRTLMATYINGSREAFEMGVLRRMQNKAGCPPIVKTLPAFPCDGSTICLTNCRCHWEHLFDKGCWIGASWVLGIADHCKHCVGRALAWNPIIVI